MYDLQRIRKLINWYIFQDFGKNDAEMAALLGYTNSSFSQILTGKAPISERFVEKLCALDKNINKVWISGKGSMLKNDLYLSENISEAPNPFLKGMILKKVGLPLISLEEAIKFPHISDDDTANTDHYYYIPDITNQGAHFFIKMFGDSMTPSFESGDLLACRKVEKVEPIVWGKIYLLLISNRPHICRIYPDESNPDQYQLISDNNLKYPPSPAPKSNSTKFSPLSVS